jgi:uncharacterized paraquat-inducible protein A
MITDCCYNVLQMNNDDKAICPICKSNLKEHSELQGKICNIIIIKQFANICPGFDSRTKLFKHWSINY